MYSSAAARSICGGLVCGRQFRKSVKTRTWKTADDVRGKVGESFVLAGPKKPIEGVVIVAKGTADIPRAVALFVSSKGSRGLDDQLLKSMNVS